MASAFNPQPVIADVRVEAPDFGMLSKAAVSVQNRYLEGFNRYKSTITSFLNAGITSDDNVKFRSEFFKKIDGYLNNLGGIDFSNPANVRVADNLMQPLIKDEDFITDLNTTMMQKAERRKLEQIKMSTDEKIRSQYSPILEEAMNYRSMDLKNAKRGDGSIGKVGVQKYMPFANLQKVLDEGAQALKLSMSQDTVTGQWIIKDKFGNNAIPSLTQWARQQLGNNYDEQLMVTAKVNVRRQLDNLMSSDPNLTREDAFQQIAKNNATGIYKNYDDYKTSLDAGIVSIDRQIADIKSRLNNKIAKGSQEEQYIGQLKAMKAQYQKELADAAANQTGKDQDLQTAFNQFMQNPEYALLPTYKDDITKQWATGYANTHAEREIEVNQYGLESMKFQHDAALKKMQMQHDMMMEEIKHANAKELKSVDVELELMKMGKTGAGLSTAPAQETTFDPYTDYMNQAVKNQQTSYDGYFDRSVLEVATSSSNLAQDVAPYDQLRTSLETFFNMYSVYKDGPTGDQNYNRARLQVMNLARKLSPGLSFDQAMKLTPAQIMTMINNGVNSRYAGSKDPSSAAGQKFVEAKTKLFNAQNAWEMYGESKDKLLTNYQSLTQKEKNQFDKAAWETRGILQPKKDANPDILQQAYQTLFPGYKTRQSRQVTGFSSANVEEDKFDYGALAEAIGASDYATDGVGELGGFGEDQINLNTSLRNLFQGGGSDLRQYFGSKVDAYRVTVNGREYMKVQLNVKSSTKDAGKKIPNVTSGAVSLYIPREKAEGLWQSVSEINTALGTRRYNQYGSLADIPKKLFTEQTGVAWLANGLEKSGRAYFPSSLVTKFNIDGGYVAFSGQNAPLNLVIQIDGIKQEVPVRLSNGMQLTQSMYMSDPNKYSREMDAIIRISMEKFNKLREAQVTSDANLHRSNYLQNPDNFVSVDDISFLESA